MYSRSIGVARRSIPALAVVLVFALLAPSLMLAQSADLQIGTSATVANTGGDPILIRESPGYDAPVLLHVTEGTTVVIHEGPITANDGSVWYGVLVNATTGYIVQDYLRPISDDAGAQAPEETEVPTELTTEDSTVSPEAPETEPVEETVAVASLQESQVETAAIGGTGTAVTTAPLNLRAGPDVTNTVLLVIPAGQSVYATASGTILWLDSGSGGIAIDMGNGYVIAMFHGTFGGELGRGQSVSQGQHLGTRTPRIRKHTAYRMTLWQSSDGGRTRTAAPYTGSNTISGMSFGDTGGANQHSGTRFTP